ncbi:MAG: hypothetical protein WA632_05810 [Gallionella sp.]
MLKTVSTQLFNDMLPLLDYVMSYALNEGKYYVVEANQSSGLIISHGQELNLVLSSLIAATGFAVIGRARFLHKELNRQATTGYLTGVPNRRHFIGLVDRIGTKPSLRYSFYAGDSRSRPFQEYQR